MHILGLVAPFFASGVRPVEKWAGKQTESDSRRRWPGCDRALSCRERLRAGRPGTTPAPLPVRDPRHPLRQRRRVHQPPPTKVVHPTPDHLHPRPSSTLQRPSLRRTKDLGHGRASLNRCGVVRPPQPARARPPPRTNRTQSQTQRRLPVMNQTQQAGMLT